MTGRSDLRTAFNEDGCVVLPGFMSWRQLASFTSVISNAVWEPLPEKVGAVTQVKDEARLDLHLPAIKATSKRLRDLAEDVGVAGWMPNECHLNRYEAVSGGISMHRDHVRYQGIILVITLIGSAQFTVAKSRTGPAIRAVTTLPGHLILLRGTRPQDAARGLDVRPFHAVGPATKGTRVSITFRQSA